MKHCASEAELEYRRRKYTVKKDQIKHMHKNYDLPKNSYGKKTRNMMQAPSDSPFARVFKHQAQYSHQRSDNQSASNRVYKTKRKSSMARLNEKWSNKSNCSITRKQFGISPKPRTQALHMVQGQDLNRSMPKLDFQFLAKLGENRDYEDDVPDERGYSRKEITLVAPVRPVLNSARAYDRDRDLGPMSRTQVLDNQLKKFLDETNNAKSDLADSPSSTSHQIYLKGVKSPQAKKCPSDSLDSFHPVLKPCKTEKDLYNTNREEKLQNSFDVDLGKHRGSVVQPMTDRKLEKGKVSKVVDLESRSEYLSMTDTIRSSYDLLNESRKQTGGFTMFRNKLYQNKFGNRLKNRNSEHPFKKAEELNEDRVNVKRQSAQVPDFYKFGKRQGNVQSEGGNLNEEVDDSPQKKNTINDSINHGATGYFSPDERPIKPANVDESVKSQSLICSFGTGAQETVGKIKHVDLGSKIENHNYEVNAHKICINIVNDRIQPVESGSPYKKEDQEVIVSTPLFSSAEKPKMERVKSSPQINKGVRSKYNRPQPEKKTNFLKKGAGHAYDPKKAIAESNQRMAKCRSEAHIVTKTDTSANISKLEQMKTVGDLPTADQIISEVNRKLSSETQEPPTSSEKPKSKLKSNRIFKKSLYAYKSKHPNPQSGQNPKPAEKCSKKPKPKSKVCKEKAYTARAPMKPSHQNNSSEKKVVKSGSASQLGLAQKLKERRMAKQEGMGDRLEESVGVKSEVIQYSVKVPGKRYRQVRNSQERSKTKRGSQISARVGNTASGRGNLMTDRKMTEETKLLESSQANESESKQCNLSNPNPKNIQQPKKSPKIESKNMLEDLLLLQLHKKYVKIYEKKIKSTLTKTQNQ